MVCLFCNFSPYTEPTSKIEPFGRAFAVLVFATFSNKAKAEGRIVDKSSLIGFFKSTKFYSNFAIELNNMGIVQEFNDYREKMNDVILKNNNLVMKRLWNLDTNT
jgi:hypothetical protein